MKLLGRYLSQQPRKWKRRSNPVMRHFRNGKSFQSYRDNRPCSGLLYMPYMLMLVSLPYQYVFINRLQELIRRDMKKIAENITKEQGKTLADAEGDVFRGLQVLISHIPEVRIMSIY